MPNVRQPVDLIRATGKKHLTKAEIEERSASEVKAPPAKRVRAPSWLPASLREDYKTVAKQLIALGIFSDLDADVLGRYLMAQESYLQASDHLGEALDRGDPESVAEWGQIQDRFFKQATTSAKELGLTVSSRCRLVVPAPEEEAEDPDGDLFA